MASADRQVGYNALHSRYGLLCLEDRTSSFIAKRLSTVSRTERADGSVVARFTAKYDFEDTLTSMNFEQTFRTTSHSRALRITCTAVI